MILSKCTICSIKKSIFIKKQEASGILNYISNILSNITYSAWKRI